MPSTLDNTWANQYVPWTISNISGSTTGTIQSAYNPFIEYKPSPINPASVYDTSFHIYINDILIIETYDRIFVDSIVKQFLVNIEKPEFNPEKLPHTMSIIEYHLGVLKSKRDAPSYRDRRIWYCTWNPAYKYIAE